MKQISYTEYQIVNPLNAQENGGFINQIEYFNRINPFNPSDKFRTL